jgi:hypothetical protein
MTIALETKDEELDQLKLNAYQDNATYVKEVQPKRRPARSNPLVILIGTSFKADTLRSSWNDTLRSLLSFSTEAVFEFFFSLSCTGFDRLVIVDNN